MTKPTLSFIGAGTLGKVLSKACVAAGYRVLSIHSHSHNDAARLASGLPEAEAVSNPSDVTRADIVFLTVPDDAIAKVCESISWPRSCSVVHCSGALSLEPLKHAQEAGASIGGLHPLQTFAAGAEHAGRLSGIAYALEASSNELRETLQDLVVALGGRPQWIRGSDKPLYTSAPRWPPTTS